MNIIGWLLFGLVIGAIAKFLMPGRDPGGWIVTILLGIAGSFVGGFLATTLLGRQEQTAGWIGSIIGALVLLFVYRLIVGRRTVVYTTPANPVAWLRAPRKRGLCIFALVANEIRSTICYTVRREESETFPAAPRQKR
ncbi:MAG: GlsB/YeaQ/YmgE family stress response membrane protein [Thermoanaerobaculia bacterium]